MLKYSWFPIERHLLVQGTTSPDNPQQRDYWNRRELWRGKGLHKYQDLVKKQQNRCPHCREWLTNGERLEVDHIIPRCLGGESIRQNLQLLHYYCHKQKSFWERQAFKKNTKGQ